MSDLPSLPIYITTVNCNSVRMHTAMNLHLQENENNFHCSVVSHNMYPVS